MLRVLLVVIILPVLASAAWAQSKYKTLHNFDRSKDGGQLTGGLIFDQSGNLYGTAGSGGAHTYGTVFELAPQSGGGWAIKVLHAFTGFEDGGEPLSTLIFDQSGNLYGTTAVGGTIYHYGVVFKLAPNQDGSWTESVLHRFMRGPDGASPYGGLIFDQAGNLYGTTVEGGGSTNSACSYVGCGAVFKLAPNQDGSWTESVLYSFCSLDACSDGVAPFACLIFDQAGNLYGTTAEGGNLSQCNGTGCGVVFQLTPNAHGSWTENVLHKFSSINSYGGFRPFDSLIFDGSGNLYGTTVGGGAAGRGVVFQLTPEPNGRWEEKVLHSFTGRDGDAPYASLIFDHSGNLYGTTTAGGADRFGVVFKLAPNSNGGWDETVLHDFYDNPGAVPNAGVIFDGAENLYGTTFGALTTFGSVFEITP